MNLIIRSATVVDPNSPYHQQNVDILIENGIITKIAQIIEIDIESYDASGQYLSPGFYDLNCNIGELGFESKEDFKTGSKAAAAGGFTGLALMPNTSPPVHSKAQIEYLLNRAKGNLVDIHTLGTISYNREGKDLAEMYDMHLSGAKAFTDGNRPVQDAGLLERALLYTQGFDALIFSYPEDTAIAGKAKVNEGVISTLLGMKGIPSLAEELMIARDLYLAEYTGSKLHISTISTIRSVELIREAKRNGLKVTCDVAAHHLVLTEEALIGFDSQYKVKPPLRTQKDVDAIIEGLKDGTIDAIVSQHTPHEIECKDVEFEVADYGIIALQTTLPIVLNAISDINLIVQKLSISPRQILNLKVPKINIAEPANLVIFDKNAEWEFNNKTNFSKSQNSPYFGKVLKGKVSLTINNNKIFK